MQLAVLLRGNVDDFTFMYLQNSGSLLFFYAEIKAVERGKKGKI